MALVGCVAATFAAGAAEAAEMCFSDREAAAERVVAHVVRLQETAAACEGYVPGIWAAWRAVEERFGSQIDRNRRLRDVALERWDAGLVPVAEARTRSHFRHLSRNSAQCAGMARQLRRLGDANWKTFARYSEHERSPFDVRRCES